MRIGYLVPEFPSQTHAFFWREILALRELGHDVRLISTRRPAASASRHAFASTASSETTYLTSARRSLLTGARRARLRRTRDVLRYLSACTVESRSERARLAALGVFGLSLAGLVDRDGLEHIHAHSCADAAHLVAIQHLLTGVPYSLTLHGDLPVYGRNHDLKFARASFVAAVTRPLQHQVTELMGWPEERVPVIQMGVDTARFSPPTRSRTTARTEVTVLTIARLNPTKGHRFAIEAIGMARDAGVAVRYVIAGDGEARAEVEADIERRGLSEVATMTGTVSEDEVIDLLGRADVFLLPSYGLGEAAPVAVMEAMSCGLAVISTTIGGTPDMIDNGRTGRLVPQQDAEAIAQALIGLARDERLQSRIGTAARNHAVASFDYRDNARRLAAAMSG